VFVVDLDQGTPVILVRPSLASASEAPDEPVAPPDAEEPAEAMDSAVFESDALAVEAPEPVVTEPIEVTPVEPVWAEAVVETALSEGVSVSDALVVAAAEREAEEVEAIPEASLASAATSIEELYGIEELETVDEESDDETPVILEIARTEAPDVPAVPEESESLGAGASVVALPTPVAVEPAWPWSAEPEGQKAPEPVPEDASEDEPSLSVFEEIAADETPAAEGPAQEEPDEMDRRSGDSEPPAPSDEEPSASSSGEASDFILDLEERADAPDDQPVESDEREIAESPAEAVEDELPTDNDEPLIQPVEPAHEVEEAAAAEDGSEPRDDVDEGEPSDGPDAGAAEPQTEAVSAVAAIVLPEPKEAPPGYQPSGEPIADGMTCEDCVYVETCPNKDQREPSSCGSFQWK